MAPRDREDAAAAPSTSYRPDIDGLRAIAVGTTILYHGQLGLFPGGFVGVDIFFVISGFLITGIILRDQQAGRFTIANFYQRRVRRIFPALFACMAATMVAGAFVLLPSEFADLGKSVAAAAGFASNLLFWAQTNYFDGDAWTKPLLHSWSLAVEEQFYLLWPLLLVGLARLGGLRWLKPLMIGAIVLGLIAAEWMAGYSPRTAFYMAPLRAWELLIGGAIVTLPPLRLGKGWCEALGVAALALILVPAMLYSDHMRFPGLTALAPCLGTAMLIALGANGGSGATRLLSMRPFLALGLISYSLYLWHWPILVLTRLELGRPLDAAESMLAITVALIVAILSWRFIERPFHSFTRGGGVAHERPRAARPTLAWGAVLIVLALLAGGTLVIAKGLPTRVPVAARQLDSFREPFDFAGIDCVVGDSAPADLERCVLGKVAPGDRVTLVWGDSHALHHVRTLRERFANSKRKLVILMSTGCAPLPGALPTLGLGRTDVRCRSVNDGMLALLQRRPQIDEVVLMARWTNFVFDADQRGRHPTSRYLVDAEHQDRTAPATRVVFAHALDALLTALDRRRIHAILVNEGTEFAQPVPQCLARAAWRGTDAAQCGVLRTRILEDRAIVDGLLSQAQRRHPALQLYDPLPRLCPGAVCLPQAGQGLLTIDAHHLTALGSRVALRDLRFDGEAPNR